MALPEVTSRRISIHDGLEVGVILKGGTDIWYDDFTACLEPGDVWMVAVWEPHGWRVRVPGTEQIVVAFLPELIDEGALRNADWSSLFALRPADRPGVGDPSTREAALRIGAELRAEISNRHSGWETAVRLDLMRLLFTVGRRALHSTTARDRGRRGSHSFARITPALELVHARPVSRVTLGEAAGACGLSPAHFSRIFQGTTGLSFGRFQLRAHLTYAAHLLLTSELKVDAIAAEAGFVDGSHLHRSFVNQYGTTPGQYRRQSREGADTAVEAPGRTIS